MLTVSASVCALCLSIAVRPRTNVSKFNGGLQNYDLVHRYVCMFVCLCVYIKQPLTAIGGGGGPIGVFALAAVQHSTFLCDIQYCDLRKPAQQRSARSLSASLLSCHLLTFLCLSLSLSLDHLLHPGFFFQMWTWKVICQSSA